MKREYNDMLKVIDERDDAEQTLSQAYYLITGRSPEWSNHFGHVEALQDVDDAQRCLRQEIRDLSKLLTDLVYQILINDFKDGIGNRAIMLKAYNDAYKFLHGKNGL